MVIAVYSIDIRSSKAKKVPRWLGRLKGGNNMAIMTKWQKRNHDDASRRFAWRDLLSGEEHRIINIRRAWYVMGYKKSTPIRKWM